MPTPVQTLESEIRGTERAIRLLIGERAAISSKLRRAAALLKLERTRLARLLPHKTPALHAGSRFPDVSSYQPNVDWKQVRIARSVRVGELAFTKLTEDLNWTDPAGANRLQTMAALKFPRRGAYHFGHPSSGGTAQAEHFLSAGGHTLTKDDIACYDCEVSDGQGGAAVASCARDFAATVRKHSPAQIWLYGGGPFLREFGVQLKGFDWHWLAAYVGNPAPYMIFGPSKTIAWQYSDGRWGPSPHSCPGIGACDLSVVLR